METRVSCLRYFEWQLSYPAQWRHRRYPTPRMERCRTFWLTISNHRRNISTIFVTEDYQVELKADTVDVVLGTGTATWRKIYLNQIHMKQAHLVAQKHDNHRKDALPFIVKQRLCWFTSDQSVLWPVLELSTCNILFRIIMVRVVMVRMVRMVMVRMVNKMMVWQNDSDDETDGEQIEELKTLPQIAHRW